MSDKKRSKSDEQQVSALVIVLYGALIFSRCGANSVLHRRYCDVMVGGLQAAIELLRCSFFFRHFNLASSPRLFTQRRSAIRPELTCANIKQIIKTPKVFRESLGFSCGFIATITASKKKESTRQTFVAMKSKKHP